MGAGGDPSGRVAVLSQGGGGVILSWARRCTQGEELDIFFYVMDGLRAERRHWGHTVSWQSLEDGKAGRARCRFFATGPSACGWGTLSLGAIPSIAGADYRAPTCLEDSFKEELLARGSATVS